MNLYVCFDGDGIGQMVGRARQADDVEAVRRTNQAIEAGNRVMKSWAEMSGGSVIEIGGDEGALEIPGDKIAELPAIVEQYAKCVGATVSVGVGMKLSEASKALLAAKLKGKDRIEFYTHEADQLVADAAKKAEEAGEAGKLAAEYMGKAAPAMNVGDGAGFSGATKPSGATVSKPTTTQGEHSEAQSLYDMLDSDDAPKAPEQTHAAKDFERQLHEEAWKGEESDMSDDAEKNNRLDDVKAKVVQALQVLKMQAPVLEQLKQVAPQAHAAMMGLAQAVVGMARELIPAQPMKKSETKDQVEKYTDKIRGVLSDDLRKPEYRGAPGCIAGHCYTASEALYHLLGGKEAGWIPQSIQHEGGPHWFLKHTSGRIADPTADQFDTPVPYHKGRGRGFLTGAMPAKNTKAVLERLLTDGAIKPDQVAQISNERKSAPMQKADATPKSVGWVKKPAPGLMRVYRIQNALGQGPYHNDDAEVSDLMDKRMDAYATHSAHGITHPDHAMATPAPGPDFHDDDWFNKPMATRRQYRFGFETPVHAREWFGSPMLAQLKQRGFELTPVNAKHIIRSKSGRQVIYLPHEDDPVNKTAPDWSDDEDLEKAKLPMPGASAHHTVTLPVGSTVDQKIKVQHQDGHSSWKQVEAGQIRSMDPAGHPTSSRSPNSK